MIIVPAIDLRGGACVRLLHGDPQLETRYGEDPVTRARAFAACGAERIHVVDLDGAFGTGANIEMIGRICAAVDIPVQTGGGIRSLADVEQRIALGAHAVVLGTMLVEQQEAARAIIDRFGDRVIAGIDARGTQVAVRGWQEAGAVDRDVFIRTVTSWGIRRIVYTEISRDGAGTGYDVDALVHVAGLTAAHITASGGAKTLADIEALTTAAPANLDHAIIGRAIYEGTIDVGEAVLHTKHAAARNAAPEQTFSA